MDYSPITNRIIKVQKEEYLIKNACYSQAKYYLCKQNNKRSLLGRKQRSQVVRSFPNRYLFSFTNKVTSLFSISCILRIILPCIFLGLDSKYGPLMRRVPGTLSNNNMERSGVREAYNLILEDLDYAIDYGPVYKDVFSASRGLAKGFKVEVLLLRGTDEDYAKVPELANEVLSNYEFKLEESFEDVFKNGYKSTEIMFSRFLSAKKLADVDMNVASIKKLMCGKYKPNDQFFDIFNSTNDIRYALTFDSVLYEQFNSTNKTLILKKLWRTDGNCPMFYMRLAQMKLFQAEALERNGASVADVLAPLNDLRRRSGNVLLKAEDFSDRDDLVRTIFYEIVREMGLENGAEWFAAVRMRLSSGKRLISELNPVYSDDKQLAWQIPDDEVSYNTLMEPNPVFIRE